MRARLEKAFDRFIDVRAKSDAEVAETMRALEVDVAVDLKGYTAEGRPGIFAFRPAPVQAHYLGYFASTGLREMDWFIRDSVLTPRADDAQPGPGAPARARYGEALADAARRG